MKDRFLKRVEFQRDSDNQPTGKVVLKRATLTDSDGDANNAVEDTNIEIDLQSLIKKPTWYEDPDALNS
jgi:hypothetical protein